MIVVTTSPKTGDRPIRRRAMLWRAAAIFLMANLIWETVQLPLYTLWRTGSRWEIAYAVIHCSVGDMLIGGWAFAISLMTVGREWLLKSAARRRVIFTTVLLGVAYTMFSEWLNVSILKRWAYSDLMLVIPLIGVGLAPLLQWIAIPFVTFHLAIKGSSRLKSDGAKPQ